MLEETMAKFNPWWEGSFPMQGIERKRYLDILMEGLGNHLVYFVIGLRRVGKTTILKQFISRNIERFGAPNILYVSMDHPAFSETSILEILRSFRRRNSIGSETPVLFVLDEIHFRKDFERELKAIFDLESNVKLVASGSSSLAIQHKSSALTGRHRDIVVKPLCYSEYLEFKELAPASHEMYLHERYAEDYMKNGGMPEYVLTGEPEYIVDLVNDIIYRDIVLTHKVRDPAILKALLLLLCERVGGYVSYNKLGRILGVTADTVRKFIGYFEEAFLFHIVTTTGPLNKRIYAPKKLYVADNGIPELLVGKMKLGALAENAVFNHLKSREEIYYVHDGKKEIDFLMAEMAVEVKYKSKIEEKEIKPLLQFKNAKKRLLITKEAYTSPDKRIETVQLWKFLY